MIADNGGTVNAAGNEVKIKVQEPSAPPLEVAFPDVVPDYRVSVFEDESWNWKGNWKVFDDRQARYSEEPGAEMIFTFIGTGVVIRGNWMRDGGKADFYIDGKLHRKIDTYFWWASQEKRNVFLWHILHLEPGEHVVKMVVKGEKNAKSEDSRVYITGATVFKTGLKKNETVKLSFES